MTQPYQAQPQTAPAPPPTPTTGPTAPPSGDGGVPIASLQSYEVAFLGGFLKDAVKVLAPIAIDLIREHVSSSTSAAASEAEVQQVADQYEAQWANLIPIFAPIAIELVKSFVQGGAAGQAAGAAGGPGAGTAGAADYTRG